MSCTLRFANDTKLQLYFGGYTSFKTEIEKIFNVKIVGIKWKWEHVKCTVNSGGSVVPAPVILSPQAK